MLVQTIKLIKKKKKKNNISRSFNASRNARDAYSVVDPKEVSEDRYANAHDFTVNGRKAYVEIVAVQ